MVNNQIGFTTDPGDLRSTRYSTDMMKMLPDCPVLHVNANSPESVMRACDVSGLVESR
jgi:2-oxoglutarate dehydrogenase E1 component